MKVIMAGEGPSLLHLSRIFAAKGYDTVVIDGNEEECVRLARELRSLVVFGDASDERTLAEVGADGADAVLAITPSDQDNLVICQLAALGFGVPRTVALANDPDNVDVFVKLGIHAFSTTEILAGLIEHRAFAEQVSGYVPVAEGSLNVTEIVLADDSPVLGERIKDIHLPKNALVSAIVRNGAATVPSGDDDLMAGDRLVLVTMPRNHGAALKAFTGEPNREPRNA